MSGKSARIIGPGLKPSSVFQSVGSMCLPDVFVGRPSAVVVDAQPGRRRRVGVEEERRRVGQHAALVDQEVARIVRHDVQAAEARDRRVAPSRALPEALVGEGDVIGAALAREASDVARLARRDAGARAGAVVEPEAHQEVPVAARVGRGCVGVAQIEDDRVGLSRQLADAQRAVERPAPVVFRGLAARDEALGGQLHLVDDRAVVRVLDDEVEAAGDERRGRQTGPGHGGL